MRWAVAAGVVVGIAYTLSPLAVWFTLAMIIVLRWAVRDLRGEERFWVMALLLAAVITRVAAVAGLFTITDHFDRPFGHFFGDEEYFIRRSMWLRNVALGIPVHRADLIYAFDEYSYTHLLYVMALVQALVGAAPYGLHLVGIALYISAVVWLFKLVRPAFGMPAAMSGLIVLLFLPTLFAWSISALKEPPFILVSVAIFGGAVALVRTRSVPRRVGVMLFLVACGIALQAIRAGGLAIAMISVAGGLVLSWLLERPLRLVAAALLVPAVAVVALSQPAVQLRALAVVQRAASIHYGHVNTPGFTYKSLDPRVYEERVHIDTMSAGEVGRFVVRSAINYLTAPLPWRVESPAMLLALPEVVGWYVLVLLAPVGFAAGVRRDRLLTCLLAAFVVGGAVLIAITGGNIGTLIRHRSLVIPFMVWLSALGAWVMLMALARRGRRHARPRAATFVRVEELT